MGGGKGKREKERKKKKKKETIRSQRHDFLGMSNYRGSMLNKGPCETMAGVDGSIDRSIQFRLNIFHWWRVINARGQRDKISRLRPENLRLKTPIENSHGIIFPSPFSRPRFPGKKETIGRACEFPFRLECSFLPNLRSSMRCPGWTNSNYQGNAH